MSLVLTPSTMQVPQVQVPQVQVPQMQVQTPQLQMAAPPQASFPPMQPQTPSPIGMQTPVFTQPIMPGNPLVQQPQQQVGPTCVQRHPRDAVKAWSSVVPLEGLGRDAALKRWKDVDAFSGLAQRKREEGTLRKLDASVKHPASVKAQFTVDSLLKEIPDRATADERACIRPFGFSNQDKKNKACFRCLDGCNPQSAQCGLPL